MVLIKIVYIFSPLASSVSRIAIITTAYSNFAKITNSKETITYIESIDNPLVLGNIFWKKYTNTIMSVLIPIVAAATNQKFYFGAQDYHIRTL